MEEAVLHVLLVFIDGLGLGERSPGNPFVFTETPFLKTLLGGNPLTAEMSGFHSQEASLCALDAQLGVPGLPQSATGQAALFTGVNAPRHLGYHLHGFPNRPLRNLLAAEGIFAFFKGEGYRCSFVNAYRPIFFEKLEQGLPGDHYSCSTLITHHAGLAFNSLDDLKEGRALYADLTNELLNRMGFSVPVITPEEAGRRLADIGTRFDLSLFEYFISDHAGHLGDAQEASRVIVELDRFLGAAAERLDPKRSLLIMTSDHGNIEDISHREHTLNRVPALLIGAEAVRSAIAPLLHALTDIRPAVGAVLETAVRR